MNDQTRPDQLSSPLFEGDKGTLPEVARRALSHLKNKPIYQRIHPEIWNAVINYRDELEAHAHNESVNLVIDLAKQEAYFRPIKDEEYDINPLKKIQLNFYDSILWTFLCESLLSSESRGEMARVDRSDIDMHMNRFESVSNKDAQQHRRAIVAAIDKADKVGVLSKLKTSLDNEPYRINTVLSLLLDADRVLLLKQSLVSYLENSGVLEHE